MKTKLIFYNKIQKLNKLKIFKLLQNKNPQIINFNTILLNSNIMTPIW